MSENVNSKGKVLWIARTAIFIALLIAVQYITSSMGQFVTGSAVNFILIAASLISGAYSGLVVAIVSPVVAKLIGIGPFWPIVPMIMVGNAVIVLVFALLLKKADTLSKIKKYIMWLAAIISGALAKFLTLYLGIVKIVLPLMSNSLKPPQIKVISAMFSYPQLITALIGGALAMAVVPPVIFAVKKSR